MKKRLLTPIELMNDERLRTINEFVKELEKRDKASGGLGLDMIDVYEVEQKLKGAHGNE